MKVAFYESDLTPPLGGFVWGHYNDVRCTEVQDRLYARAVVTEVGGEVGAIVCIHGYPQGARLPLLDPHALGDADR